MEWSIAVCSCRKLRSNCNFFHWIFQISKGNYVKKKRYSRFCLHGKALFEKQRGISVTYCFYPVHSKIYHFCYAGGPQLEQGKRFKLFLLSCIVCPQTSCAVLSHCFTDCTCARESVRFVLKLVARVTNYRTIVSITISIKICIVYH